MDVYLGVCFCIVFFSLIKLAVVKYMRQRLRITRDTSIVAGMMPMMRLASNGLPSTLHPRISTAVNPLLIDTRLTHNVGYTAVQIGGIPNSPRHRDSKRNKFIFERLRDMEFSTQFMRRFHWISQMTFFFGFVIFCLFYFLVYPNIHTTIVDPACQRENAEWFADIL